MSLDEVERYQKLLEEWSWGSKPQGGNKGSGAPRPPDARPVSPTPAPGRTGPPSGVPLGAPLGAPYQTGAILCLSGRNVAIYKHPVPEKEYHLMLALFPDQQIKTQGVALEGHQVDELGLVPPEALERLQREMRWNRDLIVFHCYSLKDAERIPQQIAPPEAAATPLRTGPVPQQPPAPTAEPTPTPAPARTAGPPPAAEAPPSNGVMRRGQRLQVRFGDKSWFAVYWGRDDQGQVVAHQTNKVWSLMHLDLNRFGTDLMIDPNVDTQIIEEIEACLTGG
jgi:hypothetical protein